MRVLYIGQHQIGSTSRMRAQVLKELVNGEFNVIDTNELFNKLNRIEKSISFRYKIGSGIKKFNNQLMASIHHLDSINYDFIWVDKGILITKSTTTILRSLTKLLIHSTPDPAFLFHKSKHFNKSLPLYDYAITTKSFEKKEYEQYLPSKKVLLTTQGFCEKIHAKSHFERNEKTDACLFIGHYEKNRGEIVKSLLEMDIKVHFAGNHWDVFYSKLPKKLKSKSKYLGTGIYGDKYSTTISEYNFSLGLLSKWIPELHTTRTFEIPACGTALITERNSEISSFYNEDEVLFYSSIEEMIEKIKYYQNNPDALYIVTKNGYDAVRNKYSYRILLTDLLERMNIL